MLSTPRLCSYAAVVVWAWAGVVAGSYDEFMSCGSNKGGDRDGFGRNVHYRPVVPCDLARNGWCETAGNQYPWQSVKRFVYENQGLMKRMYGDQRHINVLRTELMDNMFDEMAAPNVYKYQPQPPEPPPVSSSRKAKKIKRNGRAGARAMEVTMEPEINKNLPISKTAQKKSSISSSKTYSRVSSKGNGQEIRQKVLSRNRPPKAPPSERRRVPVKAKLKTKSKVDSASSTTSSSPSTTDTTATSTTPVSPSTSPATTLNTKDESTESTRTTKQMQDQITTISDTNKAESEFETTIRSKQPNSDTTPQTNQSSSTEEVTTTDQDTIEPTTNDPTTTNKGVESTVEIDSYTTVEEDTESATLQQAEFREGAGSIIYDGAYESTYDSFALYEKPIGGPLRHSEKLTTAPGRTQETFSSYTSISSDAAPPSSLTANTPSLAEFTKEYESSTARSEFPLDFGDDFLSASHDDGDLETIMFEEESNADQEEPRPLSLKERIAQDYRSSTEGSDLTTISLADRIDQAVDVRITGSSYPRDEIDMAMEKTIAEDSSFAVQHRRGEEVEIEEEEEIVENVENISDKPPEPVPLKPLKGINACPVKGEVQSPFWANNTRGEVLALLNMYPFEQYIHMEKCVHENRQMYCRNGCRCEQQYRLHRLLAFDPTNECRGIFSDWFSFPSCCVCKCYNLHHNIFEGSSRRPRLKSNPDDEYYDDDEEYYYADEEDEEFDIDEAEYITDGDYVIEDFNLEQFEHQETEEKSRRNQRAHTGSVQPSKIPPQRAPRPFSRPKSHIAPPSPSLLPPSPNLIPPPTSGFIKHQGRYHDITTRSTVDTATPTVYHNLTWIRENGRALPLFRIQRNAQENEEEEKQEKE